MGCLSFLEAWEAAQVGGGAFQAKAMAYMKAWSRTKIPRGPQVVVAMERVFGERGDDIEGVGRF